MKNILLFFIFLIPAFLFAQYPSTGNKQRLGYQTTGDGLIWRGVSGDTVNKPNNRNYPYFQLDTVNGVLYRYIQTRGQWQPTSLDADSLVYATRYWVNSNFFPLQGGTLTGTGGAGFIGFPSQVVAPGTPASGLNVYAQGSSFNWKGTDGYERQFASTLTGGRTYTLPDVSGTFALGTGAADRSARWSATNTLAAGNFTDNGTKLQALLPFQLQQWTTGGRPTGVTGYKGYNTTTGFEEGYFTSQWENYITSTGASANQVAVFSNAGKIIGNNNFKWENNRVLIGNPSYYDATQPWVLGTTGVIRASTTGGGYSLQSLGEGHNGFYGMRSGGTNIIAFGYGASTNVFSIRAAGGAVDHTMAIDRSANPSPLSSAMYSLIDRSVIAITGISVVAPFVSFGATVSLNPGAGQTYRQNYDFVNGSASGRSTGTQRGFVFTPSSFVTEAILLQGRGKMLVTGGNPQLSLGTNTPNSSSAIQVERTNAGIVPARVTEAQRNAIGVGLASISVSSGGSGYAQPPLVVITGGGGSGATAYSIISGGAVTSVVIVNPGSGYTSAPTINFDTQFGAGSGAAATSTLSTAIRGNGLSVFNTDINRYQFWSTTLSAWVTETTSLDIPTADGNGIYTGSGTLSQHTTRALIPSTGNLFFSQKFNSNADSAYFNIVNYLGGERAVNFGLTDTSSTGYSRGFFESDGAGSMNWTLETSDVNGNTTVRAIDGELGLITTAGNISLTAPVDQEVIVTGLVRAKQEGYYEINSTSSPQNLSNTYSDNFINQGGTQATFTLVFPASPEDGQILKITYNNNISTLTLDGNGNTIVGTTVTTAVEGSQRVFKFYAGEGVWIRQN